MSDMSLALRVLAAVAVLEAVALAVLAVIIAHLYRTFTRDQKQLLDRLMSRNLQEYVALSPAARTPARRRTLTDAEMAAEESKGVSA